MITKNQLKKTIKIKLYKDIDELFNNFFYFKIIMFGFKFNILSFVNKVIKEISVWKSVDLLNQHY